MILCGFFSPLVLSAPSLILISSCSVCWLAHPAAELSSFSGGAVTASTCEADGAEAAPRMFFRYRMTAYSSKAVNTNRMHVRSQIWREGSKDSSGVTEDSAVVKSCGR